MPVKKLDHVSIRTSDLEATRKFYTGVLGLDVGPRPDFPFPGVWLYRGGEAVVHVVGIDPNDPEGLRSYLGDKAGAGASGTGTIDHVAFVGDDMDAMRSHLHSLGVAFRERQVPNMALGQIFVEDPNGVTIELNYPGMAPAARP